jgi:hypothetical protein
VQRDQGGKRRACGRVRDDPATPPGGQSRSVWSTSAHASRSSARAVRPRPRQVPRPPPG